MRVERLAELLVSGPAGFRAGVSTSASGSASSGTMSNSKQAETSILAENNKAPLYESEASTEVYLETELFWRNNPTLPVASWQAAFPKKNGPDKKLYCAKVRRWIAMGNEIWATGRYSILHGRSVLVDMGWPSGYILSSLAVPRET